MTGKYDKPSPKTNLLNTKQFWQTPAYPIDVCVHLGSQHLETEAEGSWEQKKKKKILRILSWRPHSPTYEEASTFEKPQQWPVPAYGPLFHHGTALTLKISFSQENVNLPGLNPTLSCTGNCAGFPYARELLDFFAETSFSHCISPDSVNENSFFNYCAQNQSSFFHLNEPKCSITLLVATPLWLLNMLVHSPTQFWMHSKMILGPVRWRSRFWPQSPMW